MDSWSPPRWNSGQVTYWLGSKYYIPSHIVSIYQGLHRRRTCVKHFAYTHTHSSNRVVSSQLVVTVSPEFDSRHHTLQSEICLSQIWAEAFIAYPNALDWCNISTGLILLIYPLPAILFLKYINLIVSNPKRFNDPSVFKGRT